MGTIVQMPQRNRGRVRKSGGLGAAGMLAVRHFGAEVDSNIVRLDDHREHPGLTGAAAYLAIALFTSLPRDGQDRVREQLSWLTEGRNVETRVTALATLNMLALRPLP